MRSRDEPYLNTEIIITVINQVCFTIDVGKFVASCHQENYFENSTHERRFREGYILDKSITETAIFICCDKINGQLSKYNHELDAGANEQRQI